MKTYAVTVDGFGDKIYTAVTPGKARAEAWRDFTSAFECTFREFLNISAVRRCGAPADDGYAYVRRNYGVPVKVGQTVKIINEGRISGTTGVVVYPGESTAYVHVACDGYDGPLRVHPMSIEIISGGGQ